MAYVIRLFCSASGGPTKNDGHFVCEYYAAPMNERGEYEAGGRLVTSPELVKAKRFPDAGAAFTFYQQQNGTRPDGRPNRPLTAWHAEIVEEGLIRD